MSSQLPAVRYSMEGVIYLKDPCVQALLDDSFLHLQQLWSDLGLEFGHAGKDIVVLVLHQKEHSKITFQSVLGKSRISVVWKAAQSSRTVCTMGR